MPTILLTNKYSSKPKSIVESVIPVGFTLLTLNEASREELIHKSSYTDYLLVSGRLKIDEEVLAAACNLKMIQRTGVGTDMLDMDAITKRNIPIYVNKGVNSQSVAEYTIMLILASLKRLPIINANTKSGIWKKQESGVQTYELMRKTVGLVGLGAIGLLVARMLKGFGVNIVYSDIKQVNVINEKELGLSYVSFPELLAQSDIISFHCPLTAATYNMITESEVAIMKTGVIIVNTARGGLIKEDALKKGLKSGKVSFAALDAHAYEPIKHDNPFLQMENVILTPHIGGVSYDAFYSMMKEAISNIVSFERGRITALEGKRLYE
jgi:Phosphoglycerate dehydrogenase and related dehydrogenases